MSSSSSRPSTSSSSAPASGGGGGGGGSASSSSTVYPSVRTLQGAARLAIQEDKPIVFDYWVDSNTRTGDRTVAVLGLRSDGNKMLVKSNGEEYTSNIKKVYTSENEFLVETENSIYIVSKHISQKKVNT